MFGKRKSTLLRLYNCYARIVLQWSNLSNVINQKWIKNTDMCVGTEERENIMTIFLLFYYLLLFWIK